MTLDAHSTLNLINDAQGLTFQTQTGFELSQGQSALHTSRGLSRPQPAGETLGVGHRLHTQRLDDRAIEWWQTVQNDRSEPLDITQVQMLDARMTLQGAGWHVMHSELFRLDHYCEGYNAFTGRLLAPMPDFEGTLGSSEDFPFPGILFTHPERGTLLIGTLSQERCKPVWTINTSQGETQLLACDFFSGTPRLRVQPNTTMTTERWIVLFNPGGVHEAIDDYYRHLRKRIKFHGTNSILREAVLWGTWNYNTRPRGMWDINHDYVASNASALAKFVPKRPRFVMVDDGYQQNRGSFVGSDWFSTWLEIMHQNGQPAHDPTLFPHGMDGLAQAIRQNGCEPAVWFSPRLHQQSTLARDHADWLLKMEPGYSFGKKSAFLDYSIPEARQFTIEAWRTAVERWGFKAIKMDFWSFPWEVPHARHRNQDVTAIELRNQFLGDIRALIPAGGYIIAAVCVNSGNPFVGQYVDAARMGIDIGQGEWSNILDSAWSLTGVSPFYRHDCLLGDADSVGWNPNVTPGQNRLWATLVSMTGGICEIAGDLNNQCPEAMSLLRTVVDNFGPRTHTRLDLDHMGAGGVPPTKLTLQTLNGQYEARFNWSAQRGEQYVRHTGQNLWTPDPIQTQHRIPSHDATWWHHKD